MKFLVIIFILSVLAAGATIGRIVKREAKARPADTVTWGITFSQKMSEDFGNNWREAYTALLDDLQPRELRLIAYWDRVEPTQDTWTFTDLDWQMDEAAKRNIPVLLTVGQKTPRWPECHSPEWAKQLPDIDRKARLLTYVEKVVQHYKNAPNLIQWQVENEPFLKFGDCPPLDTPLIDKTLQLVRREDPWHPIVMTDGGTWGKWTPAAHRADIFGTTLYRKVHNPVIGSRKTPFPPAYYALKTHFMRWWTGQPTLPAIVTEVGLEPWGDKAIWEMTAEEQTTFFSQRDFVDTIQFARDIGYDTYYMWGAEWWYDAKTKGDPSYWNLAKQVIAEGKGLQPITQPAADLTTNITLPPAFLFGASTAAHQVEGNQNNDWTAWEKEHSHELAQNAEKTLGKTPIWNTIKNQATNPENYISGVAADAYRRYDADFTQAQTLGMNAQRISLEWSRIEPQRGVWNEQEIQHYADVIAAIKAKGMEPFVTIWHWPLPDWVSAQGGWENKQTVTDFTEFAAKVTSAYKDKVTFWITLNEPELYAANAYLRADRPPQKRNPIRYIKAVRNLTSAHKATYNIIHTQNPAAQVGIAKDYVYFEPYKGSWLNKLILKPIDWWRNRSFVNRIKDSQDFIGINHYLPVSIDLFGRKNRHYPQSDLGWELYPDSMYHTLKEVSRYNKPIYITENGVADQNDTLRTWYLSQTLQAVSKAHAEGVDIRGYFYWSLTDNFEWEKGFWPRFGLLSIDYATQQRTVRQSARDYSTIIKSILK